MSFSKISLTLLFFILYGTCIGQKLFQKVVCSDTANVIVRDYAILPGNYYYSTGNINGELFVYKLDSLLSIAQGKLYNSISGELISIEISAMNNSDFLLTGFINLTGSPNSDAFIIKCDSLFNIDWAFSFGDTLSDIGNCFEQNGDSTFITTGVANYSEQGILDKEQTYLAEITLNGNALWYKVFGNDCDSCKTSISNVTKTTNGLLMYGSSNEFSNYYSSSQKFIVHVDSVANPIWTKIYKDGCDWGSIDKIIESTNGGYYVLGTTCNLGPILDSDILVMNINNQGDVIWSKNIDGSFGSNDQAFDMIELNDGNLLISGNSTLTKLDLLGNEIWSRSYIISPFNNRTIQLHELQNRYLALGSTNFMSYESMYFFMSDTSGITCNNGSFSYNITNTQVYDSSVTINVTSSLLISNLIVVNSTTSFLLDSNICLSGVFVPEIEPIISRIYPNPVVDLINIELTAKYQSMNGGIKIEIFDLNGRMISEYNKQIENIITIDCSDLARGIYLLSFKLDNKLYGHHKLIKL
jgi:type IX secretion system substrate protein